MISKSKFYSNQTGNMLILTFELNSENKLHNIYLNNIYSMTVLWNVVTVMFVLQSSVMPTYKLIRSYVNCTLLIYE